MPIIPTVRSSNIKASLRFYTSVLDFKRVEYNDDPDDPAFCALSRQDGAFGQAVVVMCHDIDALFRKFREQGLRTPGNPDAPDEVHQGPIDQSWGTREFYVKDPDNNTLRFTQESPVEPEGE